MPDNPPIKNRRSSRRVWIILAVGLILCFVCYTAFYPAALPFGAGALTTYLPNVERVEIELVHVNFETIDGVIDTKTLVGPETVQLVKLWRSQSYSFSSHVMCHAPLYRIRFYKNNALLTEATVCFHCHNIYFYNHANDDETEEPALDATFSFSSDNESYNQFRAYLLISA